MTQVPRRRVSRNRRRRTASKLRRIFRLTLLALVAATVVCGGLFAYFYITSPVVRDTVGVLITRADTPEKAFPGLDSVNLLVMGRDLDRDDHGRIVRTNGRTDAIMLAHVDFRNCLVNILSIPRDTLVRVPGYRGKRRINSANALGGPELAQETVEDFLGVSPDHYVLVNFQGFEKAIDAMGGLRIDVDKTLDYDDNWGNLHIHLKPGEQVLGGTQAMGFVRYRKSNDGEGDSDLVRIERQQKFLRAFSAKLKSPGTILRIPRVLDSIHNDMEGSLTPAQMVCLARFIKSLPQKPNMATVPTGEGGGVYVKADPEATRELVAQMFREAN